MSGNVVHYYSAKVMVPHVLPSCYREELMYSCKKILTTFKPDSSEELHHCNFKPQQSYLRRER